MLMSFFSRDVRLEKLIPEEGKGVGEKTSPDRIKHIVKSVVRGEVLRESARKVSIDGQTDTKPLQPEV